MRKKIKQLLDKPIQNWEKFSEAIKNNSSHPFVIPLSTPEEIRERIHYKAYVRMMELMLPKPKLRNSTLKQSLQDRISIRSFNNRKISLQEISTLLYYSCGLKDIHNYHRYYPSAGACYPLETYLITKHTSLPQGLYHYYVRNHSLEQLSLDNVPISEFLNTTQFPWLEDASLFIIISAQFYRTTLRYGDRGYNYVLIEAGHIAQNLCLVGNTIPLSVCPIGGYYEDPLHAILDFDGKTEKVVYMLAMG